MDGVPNIHDHIIEHGHCRRAWILYYHNVRNLFVYTISLIISGEDADVHSRPHRAC